MSEPQLIALHRATLEQIHRALHCAGSTSELARVASDIRDFARNLLAEGTSAEALTRTIATLNDALTREVIRRALQVHGLKRTDWCWLALGSEGRSEQTLATDQDNALVFGTEGDSGSAPAARSQLVAFASEVNDTLDQLGFPRCKGDIMAGNPQWCLTGYEWRDLFTLWISEPTPTRLLNADIFFDFRPLFGDGVLADRLRDWLLARTRDNLLFLRLMAQNALQTEPPLGLIRTFQVSDKPGRYGTLDLKKRGARIFVDAARVFALAGGCAATGTADRLRDAGATAAVDPGEVEGMVESFHFLQGLRLRAHETPHPGGPNRINPYTLHEVDQRLLKEAFRQASKLQRRLGERFSLAL
jgi:CBS domain-containing protein